MTAVAGVMLSTVALSQRIEDLPAFEVASIKPSAGDLSGRPNSSTILPELPGRLVITNMTLRGMIRNAYGFFIPKAGDVTGGPDWLDGDRWDVQATVEGDQSQNRKLLMLRRLLAERFKLVVHNETKQVPTYALVLDRQDGKLGPRMRPAGDCIRRVPGAPPAVAQPGQTAKPCGGRGGAGRLTGSGITMTGLAGMLTSGAGRPVTDRTGLTGEFDVDLEWSQETPIFTALKEQLGLKLENGPSSVQETVVIDRVERPMEN